jgi:hypothetical protein
MEARPYLWCKAIWNGFDFGSDGRNEGDRAGINDKGMVLRDRTVKKDAFYWYKANWSSTPTVYITSRRFTPRVAQPTYVKVYSNCDEVELFINNVSKGILTSTDHIYKWTSGLTLTGGANEIKAIGRIGASEYIDVCYWSFGTLPSVTITNPTEGATLPAGNILIEATASEGGGGTITTVEFYNGSTYLGADTTTPYSFTWTSVPDGCYTIKAKAIDNSGASTTASVGITVGTGCGQAPYPNPGFPSAIPGKIEAENYDAGGEGVAYHDTETANQGGQYRSTEGVDIQSCSDTGGGYNIGWTDPGEWLEYTVNVSTAGTYNIATRVAAPSAGGTFHIEFNGVDKTGNITVPVTGGWQNWTTVNATAHLSAGTQVMRFYISADGFNLNYFNITVISLDIRGDLNGDGVVDLDDLVIMKGEWLTSGTTADIEPPGGDGIVDFKDFAVLAENWGKTI